MTMPNDKVIPIGIYSPMHDDHITKRMHHKQSAHRADLIKWLRKLHGWIGLWGAILGLLFGSTGILLNHRTVLNIPAAQAQESTLQLPLPTPLPADAQSMAIWLQHALAFDSGASRVRSEPEKFVAWGNKTIRQPAHWTISFTSPRTNLQAEYWLGNNFVGIKRSDNNIFATLNNLHKGSGVGLGWVLLVDTLAGSIIFLSLSGVLLWALQNRRRMVGAAICISALTIGTSLALQAMQQLR